MTRKREIQKNMKKLVKKFRNDIKITLFTIVNLSSYLTIYYSYFFKYGKRMD